MENKNKLNIGNKAKNLNFLLENKINVPILRTLNIEDINEILNNEIKITKIQKKLFQDFENNNDLNFIKIIYKQIDNWNPTKKTILQIQSKIKIFKNKKQKIILRSSNDCEDSKDNSFAGIFESHICESNTTQIINAIKIILKGNFSKRLYYYLKIKKIDKLPKLSIIIQEYIPGDISGVIFIEKNKLNINYNNGSAKSIVEGKECETYTDFTLTNKPKFLTKSQLKKLKQTSLKILELYKEPQDIEWTFVNKTLHILQTRNITKNIFTENIIWDNSNISESYSGIVLPLTCSYAEYIYKKVYINLAKSSGITDKTIEDNYEIFENLLGFFYGRFYYNITNWYTMLTLYPRYKRNKKKFDLMISKQTENNLNLNHKKHVTKSFKIKYYSKLLYRMPHFKKEVQIFKLNVNNFYKKISKEDLQNLEIDQLLKYYHEFRKKLLSKWHITVESDFLAMTYYGALEKFCEKNNIEKTICTQLISNMTNVVSAKQVDFLKVLSQQFQKYPKLTKLSDNQEYKNCLNEIKTNQTYHKLNISLNKYFQIYGGRFANELKLESENLDDNPEYKIN